MAAVALAQLVNCAAPVESARTEWDACGECAACRRIARRVHADVLFIEPGESGSIKIEQIREAIERSAYRPFEGRRRVVIINEADAIVADAQNALLKTLEEPPPSSTFVLVTSRPDTLLITVRSRCQRLRFGALSPADVAAVLIDEARLCRSGRSCGRVSVGRQRRTGARGGKSNRSSKRETRHCACSRPRRRRTRRPPGCRGRLRCRAPAAAKRIAMRWRRSLVALSSILRDLGVLSSNADPSRRSPMPISKKPLESLARSYDGERVLSAFASVDRALDALERNASPKIVADWLALQV